MKKSTTLVRFLVTIALAVTAIELNMHSSAPVQANASPAPQPAYVLKQIPFSAVHHHQFAAYPRLRLWESTSGNWSGYAVPLESSGQTDTYTSVQGAWTVPTVTGTNGSTSDTYSSDWVGLDGYNSDSVEQTGTESDWTGTAQSNYAWFEMYPNPGYEIEGFPVNPGDSITAKVTYAGQTKKKVDGRTVLESVFKVAIKNVTQKVAYSVPTSYTTIPSAGAPRSSAEWITEAPYNGEILPLADFGTVNFTSCVAASTLSGGKLSPISFWTPDPLTMIDPDGGGATPSSLTANGEGFSVTFNSN